tara:strand:+ start:339 stop:488 length:150 start_codon:yes stop_codon:yes gene_type:complete
MSVVRLFRFSAGVSDLFIVVVLAGFNILLTVFIGLADFVGLLPNLSDLN